MHIQSVPSGLQGYIREDIHSVCWEAGASNHTFIKYIIEGVLDLFPVFCGCLLLGMLDRGDSKVDPDGIDPGHVTYCIKGVREGLLQGNDVFGICCGGLVDASADFALRVGLGLVVGEQET